VTSNFTGKLSRSIVGVSNKMKSSLWLCCFKFLLCVNAFKANNTYGDIQFHRKIKPFNRGCLQ
jgi:hypothetical protein